MRRLRTFLAIELSARVKKRAEKIIAKLQETAADVSWVKQQQLHLTLKFLGDIPELETVDICRVVMKAAATVEPFEIVFRGLGAFPAVADPRTIWLGIESGTEELLELHQVLENALHKDLGFGKEQRRFQPHLTLGRAKRSGDVSREALIAQLAAQAEVDGDLTVVDEVVIFASTMGRTGPAYEPLGHAELGAQR